MMRRKHRTALSVRHQSLSPNCWPTPSLPSHALRPRQTATVTVVTATATVTAMATATATAMAMET